MSLAAAPKLSLPITQNPNTLFLTSPLILHPLSLSKPSTLLLSLKTQPTSTFLCPAFSPNSQNTAHFSPSSFNSEEHEDEDEDEGEDEQVIGDCLVFEDGVFDDPFVQQNEQFSSVSKTTHNSKNNLKQVEPENLVPEKWQQVVEELNLTKKERRKLAQELEFGSKVEKKKRVRNVDVQEYLKLRNKKLGQLNPLVLDNPTEFSPKISKNGDDNVNVNVVKRDDEKNGEISRVKGKNPRWEVYGRGLDDVTEFFNSGNYQPAEKSHGPQKLFTKEEKAQMNARKPNLSIATSQKWLPLHTLAACGEFYLMNILLKNDVDINAADQDGLTALHKAITSKKQAISNYLLRESTDPFVRDKDGATLMHYAVRTASSQSIKTLLLHNVDINLQDEDGWTPLHLAVQARRTDVVRLLLMKGADKTLKNKDGVTPLELCLYCGRDTKTYELIKLLKELPRQEP